MERKLWKSLLKVFLIPLGIEAVEHLEYLELSVLEHHYYSIQNYVADLDFCDLWEIQIEKACQFYRICVEQESLMQMVWRESENETVPASATRLRWPW